MERTRTYGRPILATAFVIVCVAGWLLCEIPKGFLTDTDELLTAERTREMLLLGKSAVHLNFEVSVNKPPLQYWLGAMTLPHMRSREIAVRIWPLLFGTLTSAALAWLAYLLDRQRPWIIFFAVALLLSCPLYLPEISRAYLDSGLTFFVTLSVIFAQFARKQPIWWMATGLACWLGALQKIPLAYLIWFLILITRFCSTNERARLRTRWLFVALALSLVALAVWPLIQSGKLAFPDLFRISEAKTLTGPNQLGKHLLFEVPLRLVAFWPFGVFALAAAIAVLTRRPLREDAALRELAVISLGVLVLTVACNFRSIRYILPVLPSLSLILAAVALRLPMPRGRVFGVVVTVSVLFCFAGIIETAVILKHRRRDVANELQIAQRLREWERPSLPIFVIRTHFKEVRYGTFYLFYGDLHFPVTELKSEDFPTAKITPPAIGVCANSDWPAFHRKLPDATIDLQLGNLICWKAGN